MKKILIVYDEDDILEYLGTLFRDNGYATVTARDGEVGRKLNAEAQKSNGSEIRQAEPPCQIVPHHAAAGAGIQQEDVGVVGAESDERARPAVGQKAQRENVHSFPAGHRVRLARRKPDLPFLEIEGRRIVAQKGHPQDPVELLDGDPEELPLQVPGAHDQGKV